MKDLIKTTSNQSICESVHLCSELLKISEEQIICTLAYKFAKNLPFSMDVQQEEYIPSDFMNIKPLDLENSRFFKYNNSIYDAMISWGDTFKSGILIQICVVFQKMLSHEFATNYILNENDFYLLGINKMTSNLEYNRKFYEVLKVLPEYYKEVQNTTSNAERRKVLEKIFEQMKQSVANRVGGFRKTDIINGKEIVKEYKPTIIWSPVKDLEMLYEFQHVRMCENIDAIIKSIKEDKLKFLSELKTNNNNQKHLEIPQPKKFIIEYK